MKTLKVLALLVLVLALMSCDNGNNGGDGNEGGTITLTDLPAGYNGKYVFFDAFTQGIPVSINGYESGGPMSRGWTPVTPINLSRVVNGRALIPLWVTDRINTRYTGNDTFMYIFPAPHELLGDVCFTFFEYPTLATNSEINYLQLSGYWLHYDSVKFSNGNAALSYRDRQPGGYHVFD